MIPNKLLPIALFLSCLFFILSNKNVEYSNTSIEGMVFPVYLSSSFPKTESFIGKKLTITISRQKDVPTVASIPFNMQHVFEKKNCDSHLIDVNNNETILKSILKDNEKMLANIGRFDVHYNMFTTFLGFAYSNTTAYNNYKNCHLFHEKEGTVVGHYDMLICHSHYFLFYYGHVFMDYLAPLILYPRYLRERAHIVVTMRMNVYADALDILGFTPDRRVYLKAHEYAHARILYTFQPGGCLDFIGEAFHQVRNLIHKQYHLENIVPTRYVLYNRENKRRVIGNFKDLLLLANKLHPDIKWEERPLVTKLNESAVYCASIKMFFSVSSSCVSNNIFMHKGSSLIEIVLTGTNYCHCYTSRVVGLLHTIICIPSINEALKEFTMPVTDFIKALDLALAREKEYANNKI